METLEELLTSYKTLNDQIAKSNELNEKIFREMTLTKVRKSLNVLNWIDIISGIASVFILLLSIYSIVKCIDKLDLLLMSIAFFIVFIAYVFHFYKSTKWKIFANSLLNEGNISESLEMIKEYKTNLKTQRKISIIYLVPICFLLLPIIWYVLYSHYYLDVISWCYANNPVFLLYNFVIMILLPFLGWKLYDWVNFPILNRIEKNLQELKEE